MRSINMAALLLISNTAWAGLAAEYSSDTNVLTVPSIKIGDKAATATLVYEPSTNLLRVTKFELLEFMPGLVSADFDTKTSVVTIHSILANGKYIYGTFKFNGKDALNIMELRPPKLTLSKYGDDFFSSGWRAAAIPSLCYPSNCSKSLNATIIGSSYYSFGKYRLRVEGEPVTLSEVKAINTSNGLYSASVNGLTSGQTIYPGEEVEFEFQAAKTNGRQYQYQYTVSTQAQGAILVDTITASIQ